MDRDPSACPLAGPLAPRCWHEQAEEPPPQCQGCCRCGTAGRTPGDVCDCSRPTRSRHRAGVQPCAKWHLSRAAGPLTCAQPGPLSPRAHAQTLQHSPPSTPHWWTPSQGREGQAAMLWQPRGTQGLESLIPMGASLQANLVDFPTHHPLTKAASSSSWLCQAQGTRAHTAQRVTWLPQLTPGAPCCAIRAGGV